MIVDFCDSGPESGAAVPCRTAYLSRMYQVVVISALLLVVFWTTLAEFGAATMSYLPVNILYVSIMSPLILRGKCLRGARPGGMSYPRSPGTTRQRYG